MEFVILPLHGFKLKQLARTPLALSCAAHCQWNFVDSAATRFKLKQLARIPWPSVAQPTANGILFDSAATPLAKPATPGTPATHPPQNSRAFEWKLLNLKQIHQQLPSTFVWRPVAGGVEKSSLLGGFQPPFGSRWPSTLGASCVPWAGRLKTKRSQPDGCAPTVFANLPLQASAVTGSPFNVLRKHGY